MVFGTRKKLPKLQDITLSLPGKDLLASTSNNHRLGSAGEGYA